MPMMTEAEKLAMRRRISREIDEETELRMERAGYARLPMGQKDEYTKAAIVWPEPREPEQTAAQKRAISDAAWNAWVNTMIERRMSDTYIPAIGAALGKKGNELRDEFEPAIAAVKAGVDEQLQQQVADAVRDFTTGALAPLRAELDEVKVRLAEAEQKLAAATGERTMPLALPSRWVGTA